MGAMDPDAPAYSDDATDGEHLLTIATKTAMGGTTLYRCECACGWRGCWYANAGFLGQSAQSHVGRANLFREPSLRKYARRADSSLARIGSRHA